MTTPTPSTTPTTHHAREAATRVLGAAGLVGIALIHLLDLPGKFSETPYEAQMYIALIVATLALAARIVHAGSSSAWDGGRRARARRGRGVHADAHDRAAAGARRRR